MGYYQCKQCNSKYEKPVRSCLCGNCSGAYYQATKYVHTDYEAEYFEYIEATPPECQVSFKEWRELL